MDYSQTLVRTNSHTHTHTLHPSPQLLHMLAQYVNTLEGDKRMLRAQVKRLASENNWLRTELREHQQLLQDTEIQLARVKEEKEQLDFTLHNQKVRLEEVWVISMEEEG